MEYRSVSVALANETRHLEFTMILLARETTMKPFIDGRIINYRRSVVKPTKGKEG